MSFDFTPEQEEQMRREFTEADQRALKYQQQASAQLASTVGQLYAQNRDANPGVILPAAQAITAGRMTPDQARKLLEDTQKRELEAAKQEKKNRSWWDSATSKIRTASRWTMATLNFVPQTVVGAAAQIFDSNNDVNGWFISTDLGTLIANDEVAGDGYFVGGRAAQLQAERARRYRGEIDGKAWTIGRGFASVISQPGSREYNILSGLVDAVAAVAIPAAPGFQAAKGAVAAAGARAGEVANIGLFTRSAAGLLDAENGGINLAKMRAWIDSRGGMQAVQKVADVKTIDEAMQMFPKVQDPQFWLDVIDADSAGKARTLLLENLGQGVDQFDLGDRNFVAKIAGKSSTVAKLMASVPGQHVVLQGGNKRDMAQSIKNVDNYLRLYGKKIATATETADEIRTGIVTRFARALTTNNGDVYSTMEEIDTITKLVLKAEGVPDEAITTLLAKTKEYRQLSTYGSLDEFGLPTSFGAKVVLPDGRIMYAPTSTAGIQSEMMNQITAVLPDPRRVRRMVSELGWVTGKGNKLSNPENYRDLRMPISALEFYQNELWRPLTLMTPGYVLRNMTDSAFRLSFTPGLKGGVYHPLQWLMMAQHKRFRGTLTGEMFDDAEGVARSGMEAYALATNQTMRESIDSINLEYRGVKDRVWRPVSRDDKAIYRKGLQDEISLLHDDEVMRMVAQGNMTPEEIVQVLKTSDWGKQYLEKLQNRWRNKEMVDVKTGQRDVVTADMTNDSNLLNYVNEYAVARVNHVARGNEVLRKAIADGKVVLDDGSEVSIFKTTPTGARYDYADEWTRAAAKVIDDPNVELSPWFKVGIEVTPGDLTPDGRQRNKIFKGWDKVIDSFFGSQYPKRSAYLMQSVVFRQFYYGKVSNLIDELSENGLTMVRDSLQKAAKEEGKQLTDRWLAQYVGDAKLAKKIKTKLENPAAARGKLELSELDAYAKGFALDSTKELFYNAAEKSNFADILRIVVPFGSAWAEVISSWTKIAASNPEALKRLGVTVEGLRDADPDNDGRGFFWKDPQTGEYVFNYPFSKQLGPLMSYVGGMGALGGAAVGGLGGAIKGGAAGLAAGGIAQTMFGVPGVELQAPAKTLNMGLNIVPGLGPMAQIAASRILGKLPAADDVRRFLTPYGEPSPTLLPSWMQKVQDAIQSPESNRMLGDMKIETMRVLAMTGEYDLSNPADQQRLEDDADGRARTLLMLRALGQFVGPTRPSVEFKVNTYAGDVYGSELSKAFRDFQSANYDTAVETFMQVFGDDAFLYMAGKTRSTVGGLDASKEFGNFERDNRSLFARYKDVAGYFAPTGSNFDYQVYLRQLATGQREKLKPSEIIEEAQALVGRSIYRNVVRMLGPYPTTEQRNYLRIVRQDLQQRFPGYAYQPMVFNRLETQIRQIQVAVNDPILDGNPVAEATRIYMDARDKALQEAETRGFQTLAGKQASDLRSWLRGIADSLVVGYPQFERIYDRVLFNEIDLDAGE